MLNLVILLTPIVQAGPISEVSDLVNTFEKIYPIKLLYLLPETNKICSELVAHCDAIFATFKSSDKEALVITGNQTVVSVISSKMTADGLDYSRIHLWEDHQLVPITKYNRSEWLVHFDLGDLYMHGELGKPKE